MTQTEKAQEVLDRLFLQPRYARADVSEMFLREYAAKKWVGENEPLQADVLIGEAELRVVEKRLLKFNRRHATYYKLP